MRDFEKYNFVLNPTEVYASFLCENSFSNTNFDDLLKFIGRYYFKRDDIGLNGICTLIRNEINKEWHLNGIRKSIKKKRVSTNQIKSIRRSFVKINGNNFVRIPFNVVSIFFYIMLILKRIENGSDYTNKMKDIPICDYLYFEHINIFKDNIDNRMFFLSDRSLKNKYERLEAMLSSFDSFFTHCYNQFDYTKKDEYIIK